MRNYGCIQFQSQQCQGEGVSISTPCSVCIKQSIYIISNLHFQTVVDSPYQRLPTSVTQEVYTVKKTVKLKFTLLLHVPYGT